MERIYQEKILVKQLREKYQNSLKPGVSIVLPTRKLNYIENIFNNYKRLDYPNFELIIVLNNPHTRLEEYTLRAAGLDNVRVLQIGEDKTLGECLNYGIENARYDYIAKMDDDDYYGSDYLLDLMNVFKYSDAQVTGKLTHYVYIEDKKILGIEAPEHDNRFTRGLAGGTILFKREVFNQVKFKPVNTAEDTTFIYQCLMQGISVYSADKFNYVYIKHPNLNDHTWKITTEEHLQTLHDKFMVEDFVPIITA